MALDDLAPEATQHHVLCILLVQASTEAHRLQGGRQSLPLLMTGWQSFQESCYRVPDI